MKRNILLPLLFNVIFSFASFGQDNQAQPFKKANTITVETTDSALIAFKKLKLLLLEQQFTLVNSDPDVFSITAKASTGGPSEMTLSLFVKPGSTINIHGFFNANVQTSSRTLNNTTTVNHGNPIEYVILGGQYVKTAWRKMDEIAKAYPSGKVIYSRK